MIQYFAEIKQYYDRDHKAKERVVDNASPWCSCMYKKLLKTHA